MQDMLNNCSTTSPHLSTNQNDSEILCPCVWGFLTQTLKVSCMFRARCPIFQTQNKQTNKAVRNKETKVSKCLYLQVYVISKLSLMFTMSIWGRSLGGSVSWDNANLKAACSWDCWLGNNPPGEKNRTTRRKVLSTPVLATSSGQNIPPSRDSSSPAQGVPLHSETLQPQGVRCLLQTGWEQTTLPVPALCNVWITYRSPDASLGPAACRARMSHRAWLNLLSPHNFDRNESAANTTFIKEEWEFSSSSRL